jgi:transposase
MNVHKNAPLAPKGRKAMARSVVEGGLSQAGAAYQFSTTPKTVAKWVKRFRAEGVERLGDRSSRLHSSPSQTPPATRTLIETLRRRRHTGKQIAVEVKVSPAIVSRIQRRWIEPGARLGAGQPERRYERENPGEIIHIDIKNLGRFSTNLPTLRRVVAR